MALLKSIASGVSTFLGLSDTPSAYTGAAGKAVAVNAGETALEFVTAFTNYDMGLYTDPITASTPTSIDMGAY